MKTQKKLGFSLIELSIVILVIGILVIGITQGSRIITQAKIKSAQSLTTSSPVNSISDLLLWIDSTSSTSFNASETSDQAPITNWYDINPQNSGSKINFSQATALYKPTYINNGINGLPSISCDGSNDFMTSSNISSDLFFRSSQNTLFVVAKMFSGVVLLSYSTGSSKYTLENSSSVLSAVTASTGGLNGSTNIINRPIVISNVVSSTARTSFINGTQEATTTGVTTPYINDSMALCAINNGSFISRSYIGEVIVFNRQLTVTERKSVEKYLGQKWQIPVS